MKSAGLDCRASMLLGIAFIASPDWVRAEPDDPARPGGGGVSVFVRSAEELVPDAEAPERLSSLVRDLGSTDLKTRAQADRAIAEDSGITLPMIEALLRDPSVELSADARERLLSSARLRFNSSPRGAMGVQFWMQSGLRDRVIIEAPLPHFADAQAKLKPGDMVIEAGGLRTVGPQAQPTFQSVVVSRDPGDLVPLVIRRGDQKIEVSVRLGRRDALQGNAFLTPDALDRAWRVRAGSLMGGEVPVIAPPAGEQVDWGDPNQLPARAFRSALRQKGMGDIASCPELVGGGMPRGAEMTDDFSDIRLTGFGNRRNNMQAIRRNNQVVWIANGLVLQQPFDPFPLSNQPPMTLQEELDEATRMLNQQRTIVSMNRPARPERPRIEPDNGMAPPATNDQKLRMYEQQVLALRTEMMEAGIPIRPTRPELPQDLIQGQPPPVQP